MRRVLWLALAPLVASAGAPPGVAFSARFTLTQKVGERVETSSGGLSLTPSGVFCLDVERPLRQQVRLDRDQARLLYPDRNLVLRGRVRAGQLPPVLDAVLAGLGDPARTLPRTAVLAERRREGELLLTRWRVQDGEGRDAGAMIIGEGRGGVRSLEFLSPKGELLRRYKFGERVRIGTTAVPRTIEADYRLPGGAPLREERWALDEVGPIRGAATLDASCAQGAADVEVKELDW
jgi:hypothetical protein